MDDKIFLSAEEIKRVVDRIHSYPIVDALRTININPNDQISGRPVWMCPFHDGKSPAMKMIPGTNDAVYCHACKKRFDFIEIIRQLNGLDFIEALLQACQLLNITVDTRPPKWQQYIENSTGEKVVDRYDYNDISTGQYAYTKIRLVGKDGKKDFRFGVIYQDDRFNWGKPPVIGMYGNVDRIKADIEKGYRVYICEGEKDCNTLRKNGFPAVVTYGASADWRPEMAALFQDARLVIFRDNDDPGEKVAKQIERDTMQACRTCIIVNPCPNLPGGDVSDFFAGYTVEIPATEDEPAKTEQVDPGDREGLQSKVSSAWRSFILSFHHVEVNKMNQKKVKGVHHDAIFQYLRKKISFLHTERRLWFYDRGFFSEKKAKGQLLDRINELILSDFRHARTINAVAELFYQDLKTTVSGRLEEMNQYPKDWINFQNGMYSLKDGQMREHDPKYRSINQIPWPYDPARAFSEAEGDMMDDFLNFISDGQENKKELILEYLAYCMTTSTYLQKFIILKGSGGNGKGVLLRLFEAVIGSENCTSLSLEKLEDRFAAANVTSRLVNICGDISSEPLSDVRTIKQLTGEDIIFCDRKYGEQFECTPYAKYIFSANSIPLIQGETADGFYRRLIILAMNNKPEKVIKDYEEQLKKQIPYLIHLAVDAGRRLFDRGTLPVLEESEREIEELRAYSDSVVAWLHDGRESGEIKFGKDEKTERKIAYEHYEEYCKDNERKAKGRNAFFKNLEDKGYRVKKVKGVKFFSGFSCWMNGSFPE